MKVAVLTSSRADYGIYIPLLRELFSDPFFQVDIIAFGTHLSKAHGFTIEDILHDGFPVKLRLATVVDGESPESVALSMGMTITEFSAIWAQEHYDLVFCLGDRYEMFAAVAAALPFNVRFAHISGGETTLGAIDNTFRHCLSLMAVYHFTSTESYKDKVIRLLDKKDGVYNTGALNFDNLFKTQLLTPNELLKAFGIDFTIPTILITFHPETVSFNRNEEYINELLSAMRDLGEYQLVVTMPNSDTMGNMIRGKLKSFVEDAENCFGIESFGMLGYLSAMKHCRFMLGNTSSGFVEASFFPKWVINLGGRQDGRLLTPNIIQCDIKRECILSAIERAEKSGDPAGVNIYGDGNAAKRIVEIVKGGRLSYQQ